MRAVARAAPAPRRRRVSDTTILVDDDQPTFWDRVESGGWEPGTLATLATLLGPGTTFVDIGAWVGPLSLFAAARGADVVAIEADPAAQDQFRRNVAANPAIASRIQLIEAAISPSDEPVRLGARRKPGDSMSSVLLAEGETAWVTPAITPEMLRGRLVSAGRLVVKIDIEGGEYDLLPHLGPLLAGRDVAVVVSFHPVILAEAGICDPAARARGAVAIFAGWRTFAVTADGPEERDGSSTLADGLSETDTWLFASPNGRSRMR